MKPSKDYQKPSSFRLFLWRCRWNISRFFRSRPVRAIGKATYRLISSAAMKILLLIYVWSFLSPLMLAVDRNNRILTHKAKIWMIVFSPLTLVIVLFFITITLILLFPDPLMDAVGDAYNNP